MPQLSPTAHHLTLVLNLGSSSLKFKLFDSGNGEVVAKGLVDAIGKNTKVFFEGKKDQKTHIKNHAEAFEYLMSYLQEDGYEKRIGSTIHRVVHGGEKYHLPTLITPKVLTAIEELFTISPLHNPINHRGIVLAQKYFPKAKHIAVFDTGFYKDLEPKVYLYAIPFELYKKYHIRKYGFHGISHGYISHRVIELWQSRVKDSKKNSGRSSIINHQSSIRHVSCHLGSGSSITAIVNGKAVDTTMGFSPLQGIMMGTRSGTIDPSIIPFLERHEKLDPEMLEKLLNKKSGILGVSEISPDLRDIYHFLLQGDERAKLTLEMLAYQIRKSIGEMITVMGGVDVITFTGGIGENAFYIRKMALAGLEKLGIQIDDTANDACDEKISSTDSSTAVLVLSTDEETEMYRLSKNLLP